MIRLLTALALLAPALGFAQTSAAAGIEMFNPPMRANAVFNGLMLRNDTEFLTPEGILDDLPQQAVLQPVVYDTIEPAAGPAEAAPGLATDPSPTDPSPTLPQQP